jgi:hypothetical protein
VVWSGSIERQDLVYQHFKHRAEVKELLAQLVNQAVRAKDGPRPPAGAKTGVSDRLPGVLIFSEEV